MKNKKKIILIAGGGTGGHLFPAIAIGQEFEKNGFEVKYIGSKHGIEKDFFNKFKLDYYLMNITGIQRQLSIKSLISNFIFPFRFLITYIKSLLFLKSIKPSIIIGTGGYASGLPLIAGLHLKIPTLIQDQNSIPGLITKKLNKKIDKICLAYDIAASKLNNKKCIITGNPIKKDLKYLDRTFACKKLNLDENKKNILILGGSQGASPINNHILNNINNYTDDNFQLIWQCGKNDLQYLKSKIENKNIIIIDFIEDMSTVYSAADLVISRAGAITISESAYMGKAMILIPYPFASENHQNINADVVKKENACIKINQNDLNTGIMEETIKNIFNNNSEIENLKLNAKIFSTPKATQNIVSEAMELIS